MKLIVINQYGPATYVPVPGTGDDARMYFDGINDWKYIPPDAGRTTSTNGSVSFSFYVPVLTTGTGTEPIFNIRNAPSGGDDTFLVLYAGPSHSIAAWRNKILLIYIRGGVDVFYGYGSTNLQAGFKYRVVFDYGPSGLTVYLNGVAETMNVHGGRGSVSNTGWLGTWGPEAYIGAMGSNLGVGGTPTSWADIYMDYLIFTDDNLTVAELQELSDPDLSDDWLTHLDSSQYTSVFLHNDTGTTADDDFDPSNPGTLYDGASFFPENLNMMLNKSAIDIDGIDDYGLSVNEDFYLPGDGTFVFWVKRDVLTALHCVLTITDSTGSEGYCRIFMLQSGYSPASRNYTVNCQLSYAGTTTELLFYGPSQIVDNNYHHIVVSGGASGPKMWIDGVAQTLVYTAGSAAETRWLDDLTNPGKHYVGCRSVSGSRSWLMDGKIFSMAYYDKQLTTPEVAALYANKDTNNYWLDERILPTVTNLVNYWRFDELTGTSTTDVVGGEVINLNNGLAWANEKP